MSKISAGGGTEFIPVFNMIKSILNTSGQTEPTLMGKLASYVMPSKGNIHVPNKIDEFAVIFLSDGQAERLDTLKPHLVELKKLAEEKLSSAEFHTLGFGSDHDARLLEEITKAMPTQGSFQYVKESHEISPCIEAISGYLIEKRLTTSIKWTEDKPQEKKINFITRQAGTKTEEESQWDGILCLNKTTEEFDKIKGSVKLSVKLEQDYMLLDVPLVFMKPEGKAAELRSNCAFINEELKKISDEIIGGSFDPKKAEEFRNHVASLRVMLNELIKDIFKVKIDERKMIAESTKDLSEYMDKIGELLRVSATQGLTNDQIASVNALAYRQVTKKSNLKTLDKRTMQNVDLLNQVATKDKQGFREYQ